MSASRADSDSSSARRSRFDELLAAAKIEAISPQRVWRLRRLGADRFRLRLNRNPSQPLDPALLERELVAAFRESEAQLRRHAAEAYRSTLPHTPHLDRYLRSRR